MFDETLMYVTYGGSILKYHEKSDTLYREDGYEIPASQYDEQLWSKHPNQSISEIWSPNNNVNPIRQLRGDKGLLIFKRMALAPLDYMELCVAQAAGYKYVERGFVGIDEEVHKEMYRVIKCLEDGDQYLIEDLINNYEAKL